MREKKECYGLKLEKKVGMREGGRIMIRGRRLYETGGIREGYTIIEQQ